MKTVMVTGVTGFIGSALVNRLLKQGYRVIGAIRSDLDKMNVGGINHSDISGNCDFRKVGDINKKTNWHDALVGVDVVIHLAARVHVMNEHATDPLADYRDMNLYATENLARQAMQAGVKRFIYVSSIKVNGEKTDKIPFSAMDEPNPVDPYGISKAEAESSLSLIVANTEMEAVIVRPPLVYGEGVGGNFKRIMKIINLGIPLPFKSVNNVRSMVSLANVCDLLTLCVEHKNAAGEVFLVSDGKDLSTPELIYKIAHNMNKSPRLFSVPESFLRLAGKAIGQSDKISRLCDSLEVDIAKTKKYLNWSPPLSSEQGIRQAVQWYLDN